MKRVMSEFFSFPSGDIITILLSRDSWTTLYFGSISHPLIGLSSKNEPQKYYILGIMIYIRPSGFPSTCCRMHTNGQQTAGCLLVLHVHCCSLLPLCLYVNNQWKKVILTLQYFVKVFPPPKIMVTLAFHFGLM